MTTTPDAHEFDEEDMARERPRLFDALDELWIVSGLALPSADYGKVIDHITAIERIAGRRQ